MPRKNARPAAKKAKLRAKKAAERLAAKQREQQRRKDITQATKRSRLSALFGEFF